MGFLNIYIIYLDDKNKFLRDIYIYVREILHIFLKATWKPLKCQIKLFID